MKRRTTLLLICLVLLYSGVNAQSSIDYYVDGSLTTNGNGTAASPWNRIWYAINRSPRDTTKDAIVYIKRGTYVIDANDFLTQLYIGSANGGANSKYLVLRPYTGDEGKVIIDGKNLTTTTAFPNMLIISGARNVRVQNLVFRNLKKYQRVCGECSKFAKHSVQQLCIRFAAMDFNGLRMGLSYSK